MFFHSSAFTVGMTKNGEINNNRTTLRPANGSWTSSAIKTPNTTVMAITLPNSRESEVEADQIGIELESSSIDLNAPNRVTLIEPASVPHNSDRVMRFLIAFLSAAGGFSVGAGLVLLASIVWGSAGALLMAPDALTVGMSGGIYGLMAALLVLERQQGHGLEILKRLDAAGCGHPGVPGLWWGSNGHSAWCLTNNMASTRDLYREQVNPADPTQYRDGDGWKASVNATKDDLNKAPAFDYKKNS